MNFSSGKFSWIIYLVIFLPLFLLFAILASLIAKFGLPRLMLLFSYLFPIIFHFLYVSYLLADILIIKMSNAVFHFYHCFKIPKPFCLLFFKNHVIFLWMKSFFPLDFKWFSVFVLVSYFYVVSSKLFFSFSVFRFLSHV